MKSKENGNQILRNLRVNSHLSCDQMAEKLGISKTYYWQLENGKRRIYYDLAFQIASIFDKKPDDLFYEYIYHLKGKKDI